MADLKNIVEGIVSSYDARVKIVQSIVEDTERLLAVFRERREEMSKGLKDALAKSEHLRKKDFDGMMIDILDVQAGRENNVKEMLGRFREEEETVARQLRKLLRRGEKIRIEDFRRMLAKIRNGEMKRQKETSEKVSSELAGMQEEVGKMLSEFKKEREKASAEWERMVGEMSQARKNDLIKHFNRT